MDLTEPRSAARTCRLSRPSCSGPLVATDHVNIKLPRPLVDHIDTLLGAEAMGYRSRAEFVTEAVRRHLERTWTTMRLPGQPELRLPD